jgi:hypothetical protein
MIQTDEIHQFLSETKNRANKVYWNYLNSQTNSKWQNVYQKFKNYHNTYNIFQISHILLKIYIYKLKFQSKQSIEPAKNKLVEPAKNKPVEPAKNKPVEPAKNKLVEPAKNKPVEPAKKPVEPAKKPVEPAKKPVEPAKNKLVEPAKNKLVEPAKNKSVEKKNKPKFTGKISILNQYKEWKKDCLGIDSSKAIPRCDLDDFKIEDNFNEKNKFEYNSSKPWFEYIENNRNI